MEQTTTAVRPPRWRRWGAGALVVLATISFLVSILAVGTSRLVLNTDRFSEAVDNSLQEPVVSDALADYLAGQITSALTEAEVIEGILPASLSRLVPVIDAALGSAIESRSRDFVGSDRGRKLIVDATAAAHRAVLRVLESEPPEGGLVLVQDGTVALNLVPVVVEVLDRVQATGIVPDVDLPDIDRSMTPDEQIDALNDSLGTNLPGDFAQLTVYKRPASSNQGLLAQARRGLELFQTAVWLIVLITVLLAVVALLLAPNRRRILLWLVVGFGLSALIAHLLINRIVAAVPTLVEDPEARAAARDVVQSSLATLDQTVKTLAIAFAVLAGILLVMGAERSGPALAALRRLAHRSPDVVRFGGLGIAALILLWFGLDLVPIVLAAAVAIAGFVLVSRHGDGSTAADEPSPSLPAAGASGRPPGQ